MAILQASGGATSGATSTDVTYTATVSGLAAVNGDVVTLTGSASKTVRLLSCVVSLTATAATTVDVAVIKRSAADTGGTPGAMTAVPHDSADAVATGAAASYTVAPTPGAAVGTIGIRKVIASTAATPAVAAGITEFVKPGKPVTLRGVAQQLAVAIASVPAGASVDVELTWLEF